MNAPEESFDYQRIATAIDYIYKNFKEQPDLEEVAEKVHLSPYHFQRMFSRWAGVSPKKFLQFISVRFAKDLMKGGNFSLSDVSYETGLSGTSRLHDLFINIEAMTPGEYNAGGKGLSISYGIYDTFFGKVMLATTAKGICNLNFMEEESEAASLLQEEWPNAALHRNDAAQELLAKAGLPIAAPSANRSGTISPTSPKHVLASLGDRIESLDVNPVLVRPDGCVAVDVVVKPAEGPCARGTSRAA